ncbi:MAG: hypothetical protein FJ135_07580 [Deltaproteobacteria bacterium]|nr:hypothetical protein [Deltaproteobacteria bacterium]
MKLPNRDKAYIPLNKLNNYLLSDSHLVGRIKANLFRSIGFSKKNATFLEQSLLALAYTENVKEVITTSYGAKYIVEGTIETPLGGKLAIRTVWIIETGADSPQCC